MKKLCTVLASLLVAMLFVSIDIGAQDFRAIVVGRITEGVRLQLRAEAFNLSNRSEFASPVTNFDSPNFSRIQSTNRFNRQFQFGVKPLF